MPARGGFRHQPAGPCAGRHADEYKILSDTIADVFAKLSISELDRALEAQGCELISMRERSESLESYYVNLVGGASHV